MVDPGRSPRAVYLHTWSSRVRQNAPRLLRLLTLVLIFVLFAPVQAAGRQNVDVVWSNDTPLGGYSFGDFDGDGTTDLFRISGTQWQYSSGGTGPWINLANDATPQSELRFGDFNGDLVTDVFHKTGVQWRYRPGGVADWVPLANENETALADLRFGDFNGDMLTDVFSVEAGTGQWRYSSGGAAAYVTGAADNTLTVNDLRFGFFDNDDNIDVFNRRSDGQWRYSSGGVGPWVENVLAADATVPYSEMALGDFDGDGITDVFNRQPSGQWRYSRNGVDGWAPLAMEPAVALADLRFGDFNGDNKTDVFSLGPGNQPRYSSGGAAPWQNLTPAEGAQNLVPPLIPTPMPPGMAVTAIASLAFGDFDADGYTDVFRREASGQWQFSARGLGNWQNLATDPLPLSELRFGDFNGDGKTDVFSVDGSGQWRWSDGGLGSWQNLAADTLSVNDLRFGDFDGDGKTDVFSREASGRWRFRSGGLGDWILLAMDPLPLTDLEFGDFDGDGITDVFSIDPVTGQGRYSPQSRLDWTPLAVQNIPLNLLRFADIDGDGRTDIFTRQDSGQWRYLSGGQGAWIDGASDPLSINDLRFGDFNGDGRADVFSIAGDGRWRYSSAATSSWILLGPPTMPTPTFTPTPTPTPTGSATATGSVSPTATGSATPEGCHDVLVNGDFEFDGAWIFGDDPVPGKYTGVQKQNGLRSVQLGIPPDIGMVESYSSIRQLIMLQPNVSTVTLRWWQLAFSEEGPSGDPGAHQDRLDVIALTPGGEVLRILHRERRNDGGWQQVMVDVTELAGKSFYLYFNLYNDGHGGRSWIYLDNMMLEVCPRNGMMQGPWGGPNMGGGGQWMGKPEHPDKPWMMMTPMMTPSPTPTATPTSTTMPSADLSLNKDVNNIMPEMGGTVVFTITVMNSGPSNATGVTVIDQLPNGYTYVSDNGGGAYNSGTGVWNIGNLGNGASASLLINATVNETGVYTNYAQILTSSPTDPDSTPGNGQQPVDEDDDDTAFITFTPMADLSLSKVVTPTIAGVGEVVTFTLVITNGGPSMATGITVSDTLPSGFMYGGHSGGTYDPSMGIWVVGPLTNGMSATLKITATVTALGNYTNVAEVQMSDQVDPDSTPGNHSTTEDDDASAVVIPGTANLSLSKVVDSPMLAGGIVVYTLVITNSGPNTATMVTVRDILPSAFRFDSSSSGAFNNVSGIWTVGSLAAGPSTATLVITGNLQTTATGTITNYAQVEFSPQVDPNSTPGNDSTDEDDDATIVFVVGEAFNVSPPVAQAVTSPALETECAEMVHNGNFESGSVGWTMLEGPAAPTAASELTFNGSAHSMRMGIIEGENLASISAIDQVVTLPGDANSIILSFRYYPLYEPEPGPGDLQYADIYNVLTGQFAGRALGTQSNDRAWLTTDYDLTMQAGQDVRIVFAVNNDGVEGRSAMYVDNVSIRSCRFSDLVSPGEAPTPDPALGAGTRPAAERAPLLLAGREEETSSTWLGRLTAMGVLASVAGVIAFAVMVVIGTLRSTE